MSCSITGIREGLAELVRMASLCAKRIYFLCADCKADSLSDKNCVDSQINSIAVENDLLAVQ